MVPGPDLTHMVGGSPSGGDAWGSYLMSNTNCHMILLALFGGYDVKIPVVPVPSARSIPVAALTPPMR